MIIYISKNNSLLGYQWQNVTRFSEEKSKHDNNQNFQSLYQLINLFLNLLKTQHIRFKHYVGEKREKIENYRERKKVYIGGFISTKEREKNGKGFKENEKDLALEDKTVGMRSRKEKNKQLKFNLYFFYYAYLG